jgi:hypothetical protein
MPLNKNILFHFIANLAAMRPLLFRIWILLTYRPTRTWCCFFATAMSALRASFEIQSLPPILLFRPSAFLPLPPLLPFLSRSHSLTFSPSHPFGAISKILNVPGLTGARGWGTSAVGAGVSPNSAVGKYRWCVLLSKQMVRAPFCVSSVVNT